MSPELMLNAVERAMKKARKLDGGEAICEILEPVRVSLDYRVKVEQEEAA
jgi:hypothetical protein